jgi:hypothetical protein
MRRNIIDASLFLLLAFFFSLRSFVRRSAGGKDFLTCSQRTRRRITSRLIRIYAGGPFGTPSPHFWIPIRENLLVLLCGHECMQTHVPGIWRMPAGRHAYPQRVYWPLMLVLSRKEQPANVRLELNVFISTS